MSKTRGRPPVSEGNRKVRIGDVWGTTEQAQHIRAAAARLTGGNLRAFLLVAAVEKADAVLRASE